MPRRGCEMMAKNAGATRDEIISAVLVGLPAAGNIVLQALPAALRTFDQSDSPTAR